MKPGTSPLGETSYDGADTGSDEPWNSEAVSTVFMDLQQGTSAMEEFTLSAANFKIEQFARTSPSGFTNNDAAKKKLIDEMGYDAFMNANMKQLAKVWGGPEEEAAKEAAAKAPAEKAPPAKKE